MRSKHSFIFAFISTILITASSTACAATTDIDCSSTSLQATIDSASDGDTINVKNTCNENIFIHTDKDNLTIRGISGARIVAANTNKNVVHIRGRLIVIEDIDISGGHNGINVERGGSVTINKTTISENNNSGITVTKNAYATIINSSIFKNKRHGVIVAKSAHARIGFPNDKVVTSQPNKITKNGLNGILINRTAVAEIVGNTISSNGAAGIYVGEHASARIGEVGVSSWSGPNFIHNNNTSGVIVTDVSFAEIKNNEISGNSEHGIHVKWNSGVRIDNNSSGATNVKYGARCEYGGSVEGSSSALSGSLGPSLYSGNCVF